jgi:hypothetical protein
MIRDDLTPEQLAALAALEGQRLAAAAAAGRSAKEPAQDEKPNNVQREVREPVKAARNVTLVAMHHLEIEGRVFHHGAEIVPGLLAKEVVDKLLEQGVLREYPERRSLHRLFSAFSECKDREQPTKAELTEFALSQ